MATSYKDIAKRLKQTREALGISPADLCRAIGVEANRWSQYESGKRRITLPVAHKLADTYGISLDWIYRGNPIALPSTIHQKINRAA